MTSNGGHVFRRLTTRARIALPQQWVARLRQGWMAWGIATASLRSTPDFIIIGAQRGGTTSLFRVLSDHPDVVRPVMSKGIGYFDLNYYRGERWYRAHFPLAVLTRFRTRRRGKVFESSGYYSFHPAVAARIAEDLPAVKVVFMVRNPVERAYSAYKHEFSRGFEDQASFERALELEPERTAGEEAKLLTDPRYESHEHRHHAYLARSRYADQLQRFVDALGPERVQVVDADRFFADPQTELSSLFAWLGLRPRTVEHVDQWNARPGGPLDPAFVDRLMHSFEADDARLAEMTGRTPSWR